ncbi:MAG: class I SAM-dependent methyltransferase [Cyanobacteria bacterium P01_C01_bin.72]
MTNYCVNVDQLRQVSQTLLITLYMRSLEARRPDGIIQDRKSVEIIERINYNFSGYNSEVSQAIIAIRTKVIDELVQKFLTQYPHTTIVNLGAGLCTRFFRLDNGRANWFNIDLPGVQPVWDSLIGTSERSQYLSYSILDFAWIEQIKAAQPQQVLFVAEGVLMFLSESEVKQLIATIQANFPQSEMIFDSLGVFLAQNSNLNSGKLGIEASYKWGIKNLRAIETWNKQVKLIECHYYLDRYKKRLGWLGLFSYLPMLRRQVKIGRVRFI